MPVEPSNSRPRRRPGAWIGGLTVGLMLILTACGSSGGPTATSTPSPATLSTGLTSGPTGAPGPSGTPVVPTQSTLPLPGSSGAAGGTTTLQGTVTEGVESGCIVLTDDSGAALANLQGWDLRTYPFGSSVQVTGTFEQDMMTTCQQGMPFEVIDAKLR